MSIEHNVDQLAKNAVDDIRHICNDFDTRFSGSTGERDVALYLDDKLKQVSSSTKIEEFLVHPTAIYSGMYFSAIYGILAYIMYYFSCMVSVLLVVCAIIPVITQFFMHSRFFDPLHKQQKSQNVSAIRHSSDECKRTIFFVANYDASKEWSISYRIGSVMTVIALSMFVIGLGYIFAISIARWIMIGGFGAQIASGTMLHVGAMGAFFLPAFLSMFQLINPKKVIDGANENLSGVEVAYSVMKALNDNNITYKNTSVGVIFTGSGKAGIRGAKAWCDCHKKDIDLQNTTFINLNVLREVEFLHIRGRDLNHALKADKEVVELIKKSGKSIGLHLESRNMVGTTDGAAFCDAKLKCATISAVNRINPHYIHTRYDNPDNVSEECIKKSIELCLSIVDTYANENVNSRVD